MKKIETIFIALNLFILFIFLSQAVSANEITDALKGIIGGGGTSRSFDIFVSIMTWVIVAGVIGGGIYWIWWNKQFKIIIRGYDMSGSDFVPFDEKARFIIKPNQAEMKLKKRKHANVIIPDMKYVRHLVEGNKVIHIFKFGEVNDYVILDPQIVMPDKEVEIEIYNNETKLMEKKFIKVPKFSLVVTESLSKEHAVRDLRDALAKFRREDSRKEYLTIVMYIVIGLTFVIGIGISSYYNWKSSLNYLSGSKEMADALKQAVQISSSVIQGK